MVAAATSIAVLAADDAWKVDAAAFVPSLIIGLAGYRVARTRGRSVAASVVLSGVVLAAGVAVAVVKTALAGH